MSENTQLTQPSGYKVSNMIFSDPISGSIPDSKPAINYKRILISTKNEDGTVGDLILPTGELFSFGVTQNLNQETGKVNGYTQPLCLYNRDGPTKAEKEWVETFNAIVEHTKEHLVENREEIEEWDLSLTDLKKFNPLYYKREKGKIVEGYGPTLYAKLIVSRKQNKIVSMYFDYNGDSVNPLDLIGKYCHARSAIKIESVFIGNKISLQVKLYETEIKLMDTGMKRLLRKPKVQKRVLTSNHEVNPLMEEEKTEEKGEGEEVDAPEDAGSIAGSDKEGEGEDEEVEAKPVKKKVVRRRVKRVKKGTPAAE